MVLNLMVILMGFSLVMERVIISFIIKEHSIMEHLINSSILLIIMVARTFN